MANPIQPTSTVTTTATAQEVSSKPKAPAGVSDVPTSQSSAKPKEPESLVMGVLHWIKDLLTQIYNFLTCQKKEENTQVQPQKGTAPKVPSKLTKEQEGLCLLSEFEQLSEVAKQSVCSQIGQKEYSKFGFFARFKSWENIGYEAIRSNPILLKPFILNSPDTASI